MAFDDGQKYTGVIIGREKKKGAWITRFEDTEDRCEDPSKDKDYTKKEPSISFTGFISA